MPNADFEISMSFVTPFLLWGAAAGTIPVILHFLFRTRYRTVAWAAMKFLLQSIEQTSRRVKFQEYLLLLARILVLVFLAIALAQLKNLVALGFVWLIAAVVVGVVALTWLLCPLWKVSKSKGVN